MCKAENYNEIWFEILSEKFVDFVKQGGGVLKISISPEQFFNEPVSTLCDVGIRQDSSLVS